jgi:hypothetical protein
MARFLRLFSRHGGSVSSPASGADHPLQGRFLGDLCRSALRALTRYFEIVTGSALTAGVIAAIQTFGDRINFTRTSIS